MQLSMPFKSWGGKRKGAGRKPNGKRAGVTHRSRPNVSSRTPLHITLRARDDVPNLRTPPVFRSVRRAIEAGAERLGVRVVHYVVLRNHLHLIAEADDREALARGMKGLKVRIARAVNHVGRRRGAVFSDRYHAQLLRSPAQTRNALAYVLNNHRKHQAEVGRRLPADFVDPCSSAASFDGWRERSAVRSPLARATSWLLRRGWRRHGPISLAATPG